MNGQHSSGGWQQHGGNNSGSEGQGRTWSGGRYYHQRDSFRNGYDSAQHRRYDEYNGNQFYLDLNTGIRVQL